MKPPPSVPKLWPGSTIVCLATGPSLTPEDVAFVQGKARVIAVNDAVRLAPWADVLYGADARWWTWHKGMPTFTGLKYSLESGAASWPGVQVLQNTGITGLEKAPTGLKNGRNSGYQAIGLAVHLGAVRVILLGYDMQRSNDREHFFGDHPNPSRSPYAAFRRHFETLAEPLQKRGIEVVNCTRVTALETFPRLALDAAFAEVCA